MKLPTKTQKKISSALKIKGILKFTKDMAKQFPEARVYLVGGFLRDLILSRESQDIDLVVCGIPARELEKFLARAGQVNLVGKTFGVFKFVPKNQKILAIDVALPRTEHSFGTGGYRDVKVNSNWRLTIQDDLARRDFTINAMAWDILNQELIDPFFGLADLKAKIIRAVLQPQIRFREDYSRLLRALRFSCQLNFSIHPLTWRALKEKMPKINTKKQGERVVPYEIIAKDLLKAFSSNPAKTLELFDQAGAIKVLMPELLKMKKCIQPKNYHREGDVWEHTKLCLKEIMNKNFVKEFGEKANAEVIIATLFHDIAKPLTMTKEKGRIRYLGHSELGADLAKKIAERLKLSSYKDENIDIDADRLHALVYYHLLLLSSNPRDLRATTIERHYLRHELLGKEMLMVQYADGAGTINSKKQKSLGPYRLIRQRIRQLIGAQSKKLPTPLLNGNEIMRVLKIEAGPVVGKIITELREAQLQKKVLTKQAARDFIKTLKL